MAVLFRTVIFAMTIADQREIRKMYRVSVKRITRILHKIYCMMIMHFTGAHYDNICNQEMKKRGNKR